jgi:hypothetical protein
VQEGDESNDKMYIIFKGSASVIVRKDKNVFEQENL